jgi:hypothetical protein
MALENRNCRVVDDIAPIMIHESGQAVSGGHGGTPAADGYGDRKLRG